MMAKNKISIDTGSRIIDIFDGEIGESLTKSFFDFCCRHSEFVSFVLHNEATDIFQFSIMIGEFEFEDWTFYRKDSALENNTFASATSHERDARLWLTISEYEEFKNIGLPQSILHKVYPPTSGQNPVKW